MKNDLSDKLVIVKAWNRTIIIVLLLFVSGMVAAQTPFEAPKPGPEHKKLAVLVGSWTTAGEAAESPFGPAEKWSGKFTWESTPGNFAIVRHFDGRGTVTGENRALDILAYDVPSKIYTWYNVDNMGSTSLAKASINGDILTALWEANVKGKRYTIRGTLTGLGSDRATWVSEYSEDGKVWNAYFHSTDTRVTSAPTAENVDQLLSKMELDWVEAILKKDVAFVDGLLADDYLGIGSTGRPVPKSQALEELRTGAFSAESMVIDGIKVRVFGDTAVVTYGQTEKSKYKGKDISGRTMWTDIFVKRNGKWQIVANQSRRLDEPK